MIRLPGGAELEIREADAADAERLASAIRTADALEIWRYTRTGPADAARRAIATSAYRRSAEIDGDLVAVWGLVLYPEEGVGSPWAMTTSVVDRYPRAFLVGSRVAIAEMRSICPVRLEVDVDESYTKATRWLTRLGFMLVGPYPSTASGAPFFRAILGQAPESRVA